MIFLRGKGIVISKRDIEEADRYITIFMEDYGKVSTVIKGIRKSKKRDKTAVDILSLTDFQFYKKNDSLIISNFSTIKDYIGIKSDIDKINIAFYILLSKKKEFLLKMTMIWRNFKLRYRLKEK